MNTRIVAAALAAAFLMAGGTSCSQETRSAGEKDHVGGGRHGWLGVSIEDVTPRTAREGNLAVKSGVLVNDVVDDSPADKAGIKEDDIIVEFNGKAIEESDDLLDAVRSTAPETKVSITLMRGTEKRSLELTLGKEPRRHFPYSFHVPPIPPVPPIPRVHVSTSQSVPGLTLCELNRQLGDYFQAPDSRGVLIEEVEKNSIAEKAGFKAGDVIFKIGNETVETTGDVAEALEDVKEGTAAFSIIRRGETKTLTVDAADLPRMRPHGHHSFYFERGDAFLPEMETLKRELMRLKHDFRESGEQVTSE